SPIARCVSSASAFSTIAFRRPPSSRVIRPYARASGGSNESTVALAVAERCSATSCSSRSELMRGWSPDTTSSVLASPTFSRAARSESPVPSGCCWTATVTPSSASAASGERTTTSGSAPSGRTASTTQSTRRRPSSGCRCFGVADFILVPRPAAMTTAARSPAIRTGAPGFEPGIAGPKPAALPLGYAPQEGALGSLSPPRVREEICKGDDREGYDRNDRQEPEDEGEDDYEDRERLRRGGDPGQLAG